MSKYYLRFKYLSLALINSINIYQSGATNSGPFKRQHLSSEIEEFRLWEGEEVKEEKEVKDNNKQTCPF